MHTYIKYGTGYVEGLVSNDKCSVIPEISSESNSENNFKFLNVYFA